MVVIGGVTVSSTRLKLCEGRNYILVNCVIPSTVLTTAYCCVQFNVHRKEGSEVGGSRREEGLGWGLFTSVPAVPALCLAKG